VNDVVPSASVVLPGVQVKVSAEVGLVGVRLTEAKTGALLEIVTEAVFAVPDALPSDGVTEQTTASPPTNTPESVLELPRETPFTVQA
jgi:predicted RecA/RadA family phage recombinase